MELDLMLRKILLTSVALPLFGFASLAHAQVEITDQRTTPISTSTIDNGGPGDIIIRTGGSVLVDTGVGVTIDSDNTVTNEGSIGSVDANDTTGVLIVGGNTGAFINNGSITLTEDFTPVDTDEDGDLDGPNAQGTGRTGILIAGATPFNGDITNGQSGSITVEGNDSAGIRILAGLNGNLTSDGTISVVGANTYGLQIAGVINGDVTIGGALTTNGENGVALGVEADVNGTINNTGQIGSSGFTETRRRDSLEERAKLDADDLLQSGAAVSISANVSGGFVNGVVLSDTGEVVGRGEISVQGSSAAVLVSAGLDTDPGDDITLGAVGAAEDDLDFGFVNQGNISSAGLNDGFTSTAIRVQGSEFGGVMRRAILEHGLINSGIIQAESFDATSRAIWVGNGGSVDTIQSSGSIRSTVISQVGQQSIGVAIDQGGEVNTITNTGSIGATFSGNGADAQAVAILDESGTLDLIENEGVIIATYNEINSSDGSDAPAATVRRRVAIDVSANTTGVTLRQRSNADQSNSASITGDVLLGSGNDVVSLETGTLSGDVVFGDGADLLTIDGGAELTGALFDSDGLLTLDVRDGLLALGSDTDLALTDATFGTNSRLQLTLANSASGIVGATFNASGTVNFLDGAAIAPILSQLVGNGGSFGFLQANNLTIDGTLQNLLDGANLPFLYNVSLSQSADGNTLFLDLQRRTASELGFDANQTAAYNAWFNALSSSENPALESGFVQLTSADDFYTAYNQVLPEFGAAALQFTLANTDGTTGAIATRLDNVRRGYGPQGGLWAQEIGYYMTRNLSSISQPYRGFGLGMAVGIDRPLGPLDAVGIAVSGFSNEIKQPGGFDKPLTSQSAQLSLYGGSKFGGVNFETNAAIGIDNYDSERLLQFGSIRRTSKGGWSGTHIASTSRLSYDYTAGKWFIRPSVSLDYLSLKEKAYIETGGGAGIDLDINARTSSSFSGTAALTFGRKFGRANGSWWSPRVRLGLRNEFQGSTASTTARFAGFTDEFTLTPQQLSNSALLFGFSFTAGSRFTSFGFDYDADIRNGFVRHTGRLVIRFIF
jgi:uncharacterized protein with beta-barrel porin domain